MCFQGVGVQLDAKTLDGRRHRMRQEFIRVGGVTNGDPRAVPLRCPACHREGAFHALPGQQDAFTSGVFLGQRHCPVAECRTHVFVVWSGNGRVTISYPLERADFDGTNIPPNVADVFDEALTSQASRCFVAAGMLVRKTLELLCEERGAEGKDLKERIGNLRRVLILPEALLTAADGLRLLGNDAAHVRAKTYESVGEDEIAIAIELTKEILKAAYQYEALVARLNALRK